MKEKAYQVQYVRDGRLMCKTNRHREFTKVNIEWIELGDKILINKIKIMTKLIVFFQVHTLDIYFNSYQNKINMKRLN